MSSATHQFCTFRLQDYVFGVEVPAIQEIIRYQTMTPVPLAPAMVHGLINLRGQIVTAIDLRSRLELPPRGGETLPTNVIVQTPDGAVSLLVDDIGDVVEVDPAAFEAPPETIEGSARQVISGVYKLEGQLLLVLDVSRAISVPAVLSETHA